MVVRLLCQAEVRQRPCNASDTSQGRCFVEKRRAVRVQLLSRVVPVGDGNFLVARGGATKEKSHMGRLVLALPDKEQGLKLVEY